MTDKKNIEENMIKINIFEYTNKNTEIVEKIIKENNDIFKQNLEMFIAFRELLFENEIMNDEITELIDETCIKMLALIVEQSRKYKFKKPESIILFSEVCSNIISINILINSIVVRNNIKMEK